jgi:hypothetical protein
MSLRRGRFHANRKSHGRKYPVHTSEDPHLRSAWDLAGDEVWATDGEMGRVEGFIMDDASWRISAAWM